MADTERTEKPTARKLRRARERGEVAQSPLASATLVLLGVTGVVALGAESTVAAWAALVRRLWSPAPPAPTEALSTAAGAMAPALFAPLAAAVVLGALASFLQVGPLLTSAPLLPDPARLSPARGGVFAWRGTLPRLAGLPLAIALLGLGGWTLASALPGLSGRTDASVARVASAGGGVVLAFLWRAGGLLAAAAAVGVAYHRWRWWRAQHMTRRELREEQRETEGEPLARRRRARRHRERALGPGVDEALARASLVVTGPGIAAVLAWPDRDAPPRATLVARGAAL
ncbi:MAG TPA: EscU/YscU/HrcU family type III secretion system export apparatus switch protein, partial [Sandaracinaceae bacterium LLY-WYZ-13_1]|nr:EscU/YscU/HrcU family type III secretion system export apparatus switch protein [Sandaracinaceae bacterium LLY-WYZ-13_1]